MKGLLRTLIINGGVLYLTSQILPALEISGGIKGIVVGALAFLVASVVLVPLIKVLLLPLNLLTLGLFSWLSNVVALYILVAIIPYFHLSPYFFSGIQYNGFVIPEANLSTFQVAIVASFMISLITRAADWLVKS